MMRRSPRPPSGAPCGGVYVIKRKSAMLGYAGYLALPPAGSSIVCSTMHLAPDVIQGPAPKLMPRPVRRQQPPAVPHSPMARHKSTVFCFTDDALLEPASRWLRRHASGHDTCLVPSNAYLLFPTRQSRSDDLADDLTIELLDVRELLASASLNYTSVCVIGGLSTVRVSDVGQERVQLLGGASEGTCLMLKGHVVGLGANNRNLFAASVAMVREHLDKLIVAG